jgi:hypothetical protein
MTNQTFESIALVDYGCSCSACDTDHVVVMVTEDGAIVGGDLCGVCTWGEAEMLDPDAWAVGDWEGEDGDYSHYFAELPDKDEEEGESHCPKCQAGSWYGSCNKCHYEG